MKLEGIIVPLITPLTSDEMLDLPGLERLVEHVIAGGVSAIFLLGSSGEGPVLADSLRERLLQAVSEQVDGRVPILLGIPAPGTRQVIEIASRLLRLGGDAIVLVAPYYYPQTQAEVIAHVSAVATSQNVPTVVYNIPQMVKTIIEPETVAQLAELPEVVAIKDSLGDMTRFQRLLAIQNKRPDFSVCQGAEGVVALSLIRGGNGAVLGLANVAPALCQELYDAAKSGNLKRAWELQEQLLTLWRIHTHGQWLPCLKMAASQLGLCAPFASAPFAPLDHQAIANIRRDMEAAGVLPVS